MNDCDNTNDKYNGDLPQNQTLIRQQYCFLNRKRSVIIVFIIFLSFLAIFLAIYVNLPQLNEQDRRHLKIPWNIDEVQNLANILNIYKSDYCYQVFFGLSFTYIFLQTFAIPGSIFLSILAGFLYPFYIALLLICICSTAGASLCFLISQLIGRRLLRTFMSQKIDNWSQQVQKHRHHLLNYIVFLRVTPFLPNWFINLVAPIVGVPLKPFAFGTFVGVAPPSFFAIQAGRTLHTLSENHHHHQFSIMSILMLTFFACISLLPVFLKNQLKHKFE